VTDSPGELRREENKTQKMVNMEWTGYRFGPLRSIVSIRTEFLLGTGPGAVTRRTDLHRQTYKTVVKLTFAKGASLKDPSGLFNSSLDGNTRRAIDFHEGEAIDEDAFRALIHAAVSLNESSGRAPKERRKGV
jgi:hypothetical protein